jgi:hypothetical protein
MDSLKNRKQFKFYRSYFDIISELENDTDKLNYLISILEFQFNGIEIPLQGMAKFAFKSQKHSLDRQLKGFIDATSIDDPIVTPIDTPVGGTDSIPIEHTPVGIINNKEIIKNKEVKKENSCLTFESFWELYDKKIDSKKCKDKFQKVKESDRQNILDTLPNYVKSTPDIKFRKNPITYLNNESWNDTIVITELKAEPINHLKVNDYPPGYVHKTNMQRMEEYLLETQEANKLKELKVQNNEF